MRRRRLNLIVLILSFAGLHRSAAQTIELSPHSDSSSQTSTSPALRRYQALPLLHAANNSARRGAIVGGIVGSVVGGLGSAAYILNATSHECVSSGPCSDNPQTPLRVITITVGAAAGSAIGVWVGRRFSHGQSTDARSVP